MLDRSRLRWTDWLGLIGLALLLVWTPVYMAQDPAERALTGGESFTLPEPRAGDRAVLDLVVRTADGATTRYEGLVTIGFDEVPPPHVDLVGFEPRLRFFIQYAPANFTAGPTHYESAGGSLSYWYDATGVPRWTHLEGEGTNLLSGSSLRPHPIVGHDSRIECGGFGNPARFTGHRIDYEPDTLRAWQRELAVALEDAHLAGGCGGLTAFPLATVVNRAYDTSTGTLYGRHYLRMDRAWASATQAPGQPMATCVHEDGSPVFGAPPSDKYTQALHALTILPPHVFTFAEPIASRCDYRDHFEAWNWFSPHFPIPVGNHVRHTDATGQLLFAADLIPSHIERGNGAPFATLSVHDAEAAMTSEPPPQGTLRDEATKRPLGTAELDETPLIHNMTVAEAARRMRTEAPGDLAGFLTPYAYLVAWGVSTDGINGTQENKALRWHLTYAREDGAMHTGTLIMTWSLVRDSTTDAVGSAVGAMTGASPSTTREWTHEAYDACTDAPVPTAGFAIYCGHADPETISADRRVFGPDAFLNAVDRFSTNGHGTVRAPDFPTSSAIEWDPVGDRNVHSLAGRTFDPPIHQPPRLTWELQHNPQDEQDRQVVVTGQHRLDSGLAERYYARTSPAVTENPNPPIPPTGGRSTSDPLDPITPTSTTAAWSGFILMVVALLRRIWLAARAGQITMLAAILYAKIRKEDVLLHERRDAIMAALRADPGMTAKELAQHLDAGWGATVHHLETLRKSGHVARVTIGRNGHHFTTEDTTAHERNLLAWKRDPAHRAFLDAVVANPGRSLDELASALPRSMSGASRTGARLAKAGVVDKKREGRTVRFYPANHQVDE